MRNRARLARQGYDRAVRASYGPTLAELALDSVSLGVVLIIASSKLLLPVQVTNEARREPDIGVRAERRKRTTGLPPSWNAGDVE